MKRKNREINIFSMSALDLFASAMGAFILIAVIALPYYLKTDKILVKENRELKQEVAKLDSQNKSMKQEIKKLNKVFLLGISTKAKSFVILIDMSGSMKSHENLVLSVTDQIFQAIDDKVKAQIIGYQGDGNNINIHNWQSANSLANMTNANISNAKQFIRRIVNQFDNGTPTGYALEKALQYNVEAILLLSDGAPNNNPNSIVNSITAANNGKKEIHAIAIGDYFSNTKLVTFLKNLSNRNNGNFIGVAK